MAGQKVVSSLTIFTDSSNIPRRSEGFLATSNGVLETDTYYCVILVRLIDSL